MLQRPFWIVPLLVGLASPIAANGQENRLFGYVSIRNTKNSAMAIQSDGKIALLGMTSGWITIFDPLPGKFLRFEPFNAHEKAVSAAAFRGDDKWFATASLDGNVKLWDTQSAYKFQTESINKKEGAPKLPPPEAKHFIKSAHVGGVTSLMFSPDGKHLATAGADGVVKIWEVESAKLLTTIEAHKEGVNAIAYAPDGDALATAGVDKTFKIWKLSNPDKPTFISPEHQGPVLAIAYSADGKQIASGSGEPKKSGQLQIWDVQKGKVALEFGDLKDVVTTLSFHPKLPRLASGGGDKKIRVWSLTLKKQLYEDLHVNGLIRVVYTPGGRLLGSICPDEGKWWNGTPKVQ